MTDFYNPDKTTTASPVSGEPLFNSGFWPLPTLGGFRESERVDATVESGQALTYLQSAIHRTETELASWVASLDIDSWEELENSRHARFEYLNAVYSFAKYLTLTEYVDYDTTQTGMDRGKQMAERTDDCLLRWNTSLASIRGESETVVELI